MVREARFLWSDPFENPSDTPADDADEWDDLDLSPLHRQKAPRIRSLRTETPWPSESSHLAPRDDSPC
jgi:hypothetical protein